MEKILTLFLILFIRVLTINCDPCLTYKVLDTQNEDARSVANAALPSAICDNTLEAGWYRVTSFAGERMPTECVYGGMRCGTSMSIWMNGTYPNAGDVKTVQACAAHYDGDCCKHSYDIEVKNCTNYLVYNLVPVSTCYQAYCFGSELACPAGETSDNNGFTPGCRYEPCLEENHQTLDHWERSVNNPDIGNLCDNTLTPGWYRPISAVGNTMPTECPVGGYKCGTSSPIWMDGSYPSSGEIANVTACVGNYNGGCCTSSYDIQVKNCDEFYIYNLKPTSGCYQAYCFGTEIKCPVGETSDNEGFTPGCEFDPCHSSNYGILEGEMKRSSNYTLQSDDVAIEDSRLTTGWYKINSVTGNDIVNETVGMMQCGTLYPLWMEGSLPDVSDKTVDRKVCQSGLYTTCDQKYDIKVRNCGNYRTYYLTQLNVDKSAYCFGTFPVPDPTTTTPTITTTRRPPPVDHNPSKDDEDEKDDKPYIWVIVGMLAVLSTILLAILLVKFFLQRTVSKRAVSFVDVKGKLPTYDEAILQNEKNNGLQMVQTVTPSNPANQFIGSMTSVPPNSTKFGQMKLY
ncbi:Hypothetical predicted protein [Mytilus galloprovincialis]|uniref:UMOD/GP2/OIT3-like D8C domain-containing protein n=1 Tax=Mytilus galloprovincialis TaxID=29158 RepID=A0A8B6FYW4_MYTGA|nr:Hypothetical predicted protein [Mytilus galloprovincialis]